MTEPENVTNDEAVTADDASVEATATTEPEAPAEPEVPLKPLDNLGAMILENIVSTAGQYNALASRVKKASGDPQAVLDDLRENPPNEDAKKYTDAIEALDNQREALINARDEILKPLVAAHIEEAKSGLGNSEAEAKELLKTVNAGKKYFADLYDERHLEGKVPALVSLRAAVSGGASGSDGRSGQRIRGFDVYVDGQHITATVNGKTVSNLATAAKHLGVETADLRDRFQAAAGTKDPKSYPKQVDFTFEVGEGEARKAVAVRCVKAENDSE